MSQEINSNKNELYYQLIDSFPDMLFFLDRDFNIIDINETAKESINIPIKGKKCFEVFGYDKKCDLCPTAEAFNKKETVTIEKFKPLLKKWYEVSSIPILNSSNEVIAVVEQLKDITKRNEMEDALKKSELKFRNYVENSQDIIFTLDKSGKFEYVSPSWKDPLNYRLDEVEGRNFLEFIHPKDKDKAKAFLENVFSKSDPEPMDYR